ncbi:hypothetical protein [Actinomadura rudentiformis]|uniref:DUF7847 domain-containing protein n=1 Tax=Actinomadura rudentiformis TaxID=359158 RepID=A0A6H9YTA7_9ACTN|nr:hypothetical protein [Actinomadura rudentiformis]KAB2351504.1 hypothetical protein F8566_04525 [Actinomadura rudentiformis]
MPGPKGWEPDDAPLLGGDVPFRPMSISEMMDGAIAGIRRHPRAALGLSVAVTTVIQVLGSLAAYYLLGPEASGGFTRSKFWESVGTQLWLGALGMTLSAYGILLLSGFLGPVLGRSMFERPASLRQAWRDTRPRLGRLAAVSAVVILAALLGLILPLAPFALLVATEAHPALSVLAGVVAIPAGLALMIWLYVLLVLGAPAVVLERQTFTGALRRATALSRGRWWRTCGTLLLTMMITVFMGFFALRIPFLVADLIFFERDPHGTELVLKIAVDTVGRIVSWSVVLPFDAGVIALLYFDRRMRREGLDLDLRTRPAEDSIPAPVHVPATDDGFFDLWRPSPLITSPYPGDPHDH